MAIWQYLWAGSSKTLWLYHLDWNANDSSWNSNNWIPTAITWVWGKIWSWAAQFNWTTSVITILNQAAQEIQTLTWALTIKNDTYKSMIYKRNWYASFNIAYNIWIYSLWVYFIQQNWSSTLMNLWIEFPQSTWIHKRIVIKKEPTLWTLYQDWKKIWTLTWYNILYSTWDKNNFVWKNPLNTTETITWNIDEIIFENVGWTDTQVMKDNTYSRGLYAIL